MNGYVDRRVHVRPSKGSGLETWMGDVQENKQRGVLAFVFNLLPFRLDHIPSGNMVNGVSDVKC